MRRYLNAEVHPYATMEHKQSLMEASQQEPKVHGVSSSLRSKLLRAGVIIASTVVLSACGSLGGGGDGLGGTRFYSLTPLALAETKAVASNPSLKIGVGPIRMSRLLKRPQIITRKSATEIAMAEKHQWGGLLKEDLSLTLAENFSGLLGTNNVEQYPWKMDFKPKYHVRIDIDQLDGTLGKSVTLKARWRLMRGREEITIENSTITADVKGSDYNAYVAAQSDALLQLTRLIAKRMR